MSLNVKDPEARRLAQAIADATGQSMSRVVTEALRERYARLRQPSAKASVEELLAIADHAAAHVKRPYLEHGDLLYDERGLPKRLWIPPQWSRFFIERRRPRPL